MQDEPRSIAPDVATIDMLAQVQDAFGARAPDVPVRYAGDGRFDAAFAIDALAGASIAAVGLAVADWIGWRSGYWPEVSIDQRLASLWFRGSLQTMDWTPPSPWDSIAGDYRAADGWIRLHTNAPRHRQAALRVLGVVPDRHAVSAAVASWDAQSLEDAVVEAGGCAARMRGLAQWAAHPQGRQVAAEPVVACEPIVDDLANDSNLRAAGAAGFDAARPLAGVRVLDLTRVLAGPVATRTLAGLGAEVLRIDPIDWDEPAIVPELTVGKRLARLDARSRAGRERLLALLGEADILVHGYRPGALAGLGLDEEQRRRARPGLVDVCLDAYGWTGPWAGRRGFDSLVQMSAGIADAGMRVAGGDQPRPLPVQALDHATGYLMAAAAIRGLLWRGDGGTGWHARLSLARTAALLSAHPATPGPVLAEADPGDYASRIEATDWGPARRLTGPLRVGAAHLRWDLPARALGSDLPAWA